jgi:hypothetical protein
MSLGSIVTAAALVTMFIIFVAYINSPVKIYGRDLSVPRKSYNQVLDVASEAKRQGTLKSFQNQKQSSSYREMIQQFGKGLDIDGSPLYKDNSDFLYSAFNPSQ